MKKYLGFNRDLFEIVLFFIAWRIWITVFALLGIILLQPPSRDLFGGGFENYITNPLFWGWSNFDGEHYVSIAQKGYGTLTHAFFPGYPFLIKQLSPEGLSRIVFTGQAVSSLFFLLSLIVLWQLIRLDYPREVARFALVLLVTFPTSFFFGSVYGESLLLFLTLLSFFLARKAKWFPSSLIASIASATRIFGIVLLPSLFIEWLLQRKGGKITIRDAQIFTIALAGLGLLLYMLYLYKTTGNPLSFYTEQKFFAQGRVSDKLILLPQVFWRYFKMLLTVQKTSPLYFTVWMEFLSGILGSVLIVYGYFRKVRYSYLAFATISFLLPTLTGSFTSLPRYTLVIFPFFIIGSLWLSDAKKKTRVAIISLFVVLLGIKTMMFVTGYWVA